MRLVAEAGGACCCREWQSASRSGQPPLKHKGPTWAALESMKQSSRGCVAISAPGKCRWLQRSNLPGLECQIKL